MQMPPEGTPSTSLESVIDPHWPPPLMGASFLLPVLLFRPLPTLARAYTQLLLFSPPPFLLLAGQSYSPVVASASGQ